MNAILFLTYFVLDTVDAQAGQGQEGRINRFSASNTSTTPANGLDGNHDLHLCFLISISIIKALNLVLAWLRVLRCCAMFSAESLARVSKQFVTATERLKVFYEQHGSQK